MQIAGRAKKMQGVCHSGAARALRIQSTILSNLKVRASAYE
jgi:hypothetical protein